MITFTKEDIWQEQVEGEPMQATLKLQDTLSEILVQLKQLVELQRSTRDWVAAGVREERRRTMGITRNSNAPCG